MNGAVNGKKQVVSDDDKPLLSQSSVPMSTPRAKPPRKKRKVDISPPESEDDMPLNNLLSSSSPVKQRPATPGSDSDNDEAESPAKTPKKRKTPETKPKAKRAKKTKSEDAEEKVPAPKKKAKEKEAANGEDSPRKKSKKEEEEEILYKWWEKNEAGNEGAEGEGEAPTHEDIHGDGTKKWTTLRHEGVLFPPPYTPLPSTVKFHYDGLYKYPLRNLPLIVILQANPWTYLPRLKKLLISSPSFLAALTSRIRHSRPISSATFRIY